MPHVLFGHPPCSLLLLLLPSLLLLFLLLLLLLLSLPLLLSLLLLLLLLLVAKVVCYVYFFMVLQQSLHPECWLNHLVLANHDAKSWGQCLMVNTLCCSTCQQCIRAAWDGITTSAILKSCLAEKHCVLPCSLLACGVAV